LKRYTIKTKIKRNNQRRIVITQNSWHKAYIRSVIDYVVERRKPKKNEETLDHFIEEMKKSWMTFQEEMKKLIS